MVKAMLRMHFTFNPQHDDGSTKGLRSTEYIWLGHLSPPPMRAKALVCFSCRVEYESCLGVRTAFIRHLKTGRVFKTRCAGANAALGGGWALGVVNLALLGATPARLPPISKLCSYAGSLHCKPAFFSEQPRGSIDEG